MRDIRDARLRNDSHESSRPTLATLFAAIMQSFCALHRIAWSAPWQEERP